MEKMRAERDAALERAERAEDLARDNSHANAKAKVTREEADAISRDHLYEFKLCSTLRLEHNMQAALYAAMRCIEEDWDSAACTLVNARTGEQRKITVRHGDCETFIRRVVARACE